MTKVLKLVWTNEWYYQSCPTVLSTQLSVKIAIGVSFLFQKLRGNSAKWLQSHKTDDTHRTHCSVHIVIMSIKWLKISSNTHYAFVYFFMPLSFWVRRCWYIKGLSSWLFIFPSLHTYWIPFEFDGYMIYKSIFVSKIHTIVQCLVILIFGHIGAVWSFFYILNDYYY